MARQLQLLLALLIALSTFANASMAITTLAQEAPTKKFTSQLTGSVVDIGNSPDANFDVGSHLVFDSGTGYTQEDIYIDIPGGYFAVSFAEGDVNPQKWQNETIDNVESWYTDYADILGQEVDETETWLFTRGVNYASFSEYMYGEYRQEFGIGSTVDVYVFGIESTILDEIVWIQENVTIDGEQVFASTDLANIQAMMNGTSSYQPERLPGFTSELSDWEDQGITSATSWEPPLFDVVVSWDGDTLQLPLHNERAVETSSDSSQTYLRIYAQDPAGSVRVLVFQQHDIPDEMSTLEFYENRYTSQEWLIDNGLNYPAIDSIVSENGVAVAYSTTDFYGQDTVSIRTVWELPDGFMIAVDAINHPHLVVSTYEQMLGSVRIDGEPVAQLWSIEELEAMFPPQENDGETAGSETNVQEDSTETTRTSRGSSNDSSPTDATSSSGELVTAELSGVTINLGSSGEAVFVPEYAFSTQTDDYTLESFTVEYGSTLVIIDVMEGDVDVEDYMLSAEADIAATYDYMEWLGGEWSGTYSWDMYSGAYKLDYREVVYLDLAPIPGTDLFIAVGVYGTQDGIADDIIWLQDNITVDDQGILANANPSSLESVADGTSDYEAEAVLKPETSVEDWAEVGLVSETEWQSPYTDTAFTWDGERLVFPFAQSNPVKASDGVTELELRTPDRRGEITLSTAVVDYVPADWVANFTSDEYLKSRAEDGFPITVLDSRVAEESGSIIWLEYTDFGHPVVVIMDVYVNADGVTIVTEIQAAPEDIAEIYAIFWDSVQSNGDYYPLTWTIEEIEAFEVE